MVRLPNFRERNWKTTVEDWLAVSHNLADGTLKSGIVTSAKLEPQLLARTSPRRHTIAALGDSLTSNGLTNGGPNAVNWLMHCVIASGGRLQWIENVGNGGYKAADILATNVPILLDLNPRPGYVAVLAGTNDLGPTSYASYTATMSTIYDTLQAAGIIPIAISIPPSDIQSVHANITKFNTWLQAEAQRRGVPWVNWNHALMKPWTSGMWKDTYSIDGTHFSGIGAKAAGDAMWARLSPYLGDLPPWEAPLAMSQGDPHNLFPNGLFIADANVDGLSDNMAITGTSANVSASRVDPSDGVTVGKWQRLTRTVGSTAASALMWTDLMTGVAVGDRIAVSFRVQASLTGTTDAESVGQVGLILDNVSTGAGGNVNATGTDRNRFWLNTWRTTIAPMTVYQELTIKAGMTGGIRFVCNLGTDTPEGDWIQIAQLTVRNLTQIAAATGRAPDPVPAVDANIVTNTHPNPGAESGTTGTLPGTTTITQDATVFRSGANSFKIVGAGSPIWRTNTGLGYTGTSQPCRAWFWAKGTGSVTASMRFVYTDASTGAFGTTITVPLIADEWRQIQVPEIANDTTKTVNFIDVQVATPIGVSLTWWLDDLRVGKKV